MQPSELGRYRIEREIGRGAMGRVYLAHDPEIDRKVAIKTVPHAAGEGEESRQRFLREVRAVGRLLHPGIVTIFDVGEADDLLWLAMELVDGETFDTFCEADQRLPTATVCALIAEAAEALHHAHGVGLVHRDIKPANLMRVEGDHVKVMDFGLAKTAQANMTHDGTLLGTPSYMSPEQIRGGTLDGRTDLFSLAVVLYEMLTGIKPFPGESISSIIFRIVNDDPDGFDEIDTHLPGPLGDFLRKALAKDPDARFADGAAFAKALREAAAGAAPAVAEPVARPAAASASAAAPAAEESSIPPREDPRARRRTAAPRSSVGPYLLALVLLIGAAAGGAYAFREELGIDWFDSLTEPAVVTYETTVRTQPPGLAITLDGQPLPSPIVTFRAEELPRLLVAEEGCRRVEHELTLADAGGQVMLVIDPTDLEVAIDPGAAGATVALNDEVRGEAPLAATLDLCSENVIRASAPGFEPTELTLPAGLTRTEARTRLATLSLAETPRGMLKIASPAHRVTLTIDGRRVSAGDHELEVGSYRVRAVNRDLWIDVSERVTIEAGATRTISLALPALADLTVQSFPPNCKVYLRRGEGDWRFVANAPLTARVAVGDYQVRVEQPSSGATRDQGITLSAGANPPVRVPCGGSS